MNTERKDIAEEELVSGFLKICYQNTYPEKTNVIVPGDQANSLYYVVEGSLTVSMPGEDQREYILSYLNPGDFIGEMGLFVPSHRREVHIMTRTQCILAKVSYAQLWESLEGELSPYAIPFLALISQKISLRLLKSNRKVLTLSSLDVEGRIARTLADLAKEPTAISHSSGIEIKITREELSRLVGCSRELAGKTLKAIESRGAISTRGRSIIIPDSEALLMPNSGQ